MSIFSYLSNFLTLPLKVATFVFTPDKRDYAERKIELALRRGLRNVGNYENKKKAEKKMQFYFT